MTHIHRPPAHLLSRAVRVLVVGCGGTGSAVAGGLPYLHQAMVARGHPHGLDVTLQDGDAVSPTNCVRQPFSMGEVGHNKAVVLASRMNLFWGLRWKAVPRHLTASDTSTDGIDLVIGCVDSREARQEIDDYTGRINSTVHYWLDFGNNADSGQFVLGVPYNGMTGKKRGRLPTAAELWPEIVDTARPAEVLPSCSAAEALTRQHPFINQVLAQHGLSLLARLFAGGIEHHGGFVNLATGRVAALRVPDPPAEDEIVAEEQERKRAAKVGRVRTQRQRAAAAAGGTA